MDYRMKAEELLKDFTHGRYLFGVDVLDEVGAIAAGHGKRALVISNTTYLKPVCDRVLASLEAHGVELAGGVVVPDAAPNAPREDVYRIESYILHTAPDCLISIGGGSAIDAVKAADVLASLGSQSHEIEDYFGSNLVSEAVSKEGRALIPHIAIQTSASSGAHLTKYSNITDPVKGQKKLIVDDAIIPQHPVFDYAVTTSMPTGLSVDGALDGISHCLEVFYGANEETYELLAQIMEAALHLILKYTPRIIADPSDIEARQGIGLATDLGGYAIMIGGTNGAHLTSFSLVDITSHGRACGIMNPYYMVFFAPSVERQLRLVGSILSSYGYITDSLDAAGARQLGLTVAEGLRSFSRAIGSPVTLSEIPGFTDAHIERAAEAAKNPQLRMKLQNMPIPLTAELIDTYMRPILEAAKTGDFSLIRPYS
ncbi:MAG: iron-containing alcohol dehydrogenase [Spirochaetia bacterium]|nr:iron-containing alcohol dehydrogenase [Spirochaetia bacterium]MCF7941215.1 iron-containing alcohol dehydrogenase [Spirochaetia bacterium]